MFRQRSLPQVLHLSIKRAMHWPNMEVLQHLLPATGEVASCETLVIDFVVPSLILWRWRAVQSEPLDAMDDLEYVTYLVMRTLEQYMVGCPRLLRASLAMDVTRPLRGNVRVLFKASATSPVTWVIDAYTDSTDPDRHRLHLLARQQQSQEDM